MIEELEIRCWERIQMIVKNEEGLGIEFDENVICDVCRSVSNVCIHLSHCLIIFNIVQVEN